MERRGPTHARRARAWALGLSLLGLLGGCAQSGPLTARRTTIGSLKSSVSQLESEKEALRRELAEQKSENRRLENRLVDAEAENGSLAARLDDARNLISRQGGDTSALASPTLGDPPLERPSRPTRPARKGNKTPFAEIRGDLRPVAPDDEADLEPPAGRDDFGPQSRRYDSEPWLPVASGAGGSRALGDPGRRR